mmetsp:Transcript_8494/g.16014  ORF Transcript_8494/g.16014 Transcript_8494/m.16014 type:complete len:331 (+) Transcript_8494:148-1140(+)
MNPDLLAILSAGAPDSPALRPLAALSSPFAFGGRSKATLDLNPSVQWGPSLVLIQDHMSICGGCIGPKTNNCFCLNPLDDGTMKGCTIGKHALLKHPSVTADDALNSMRIYLHKGAGKNVAYAAPWVDAASLSSSDLATLLGKVYKSWEEWNADAMIFQTAPASKQDVARIQTAVKATKTIPRFEGSGKNLFDTAEESEVSLDFEAKLKILEAGIKDLLKFNLVIEPFKEDEELSDQELKMMEIVEKVGLLERALAMLSDVSTRSMRDLHLGLAVRLAGLETILGSVSALDGRLGFESATITAALEHLYEQIVEIKKGFDLKVISAQVMK